MGKITGREELEKVPPKVRQMYRAVVELIGEGEEIAELRVSTITGRAGIGKGTAYEYFDSKEEIVACAITYAIESSFRRLETELLEKEDFCGQLEYLLDEIERKDDRKVCFLRFLHLLTDTSDFSDLIRQKLCMESISEGTSWRYTPTTVFCKVLERARERGELRGDLPMDYMIYSLFSHLMLYMMAVTAKQGGGTEGAAIRPYVRQAIMKDLNIGVQVMRKERAQE